MKLLSLDIENYGVFSGTRFDLTNHGFQALYGPNEAGKTTLLQLIREALFGFPIRNPYSLAHHAGEMAATVEMELSDGRHVRFRRRKGRVRQVVGELTPSGVEIDADELSRLLSGASAQLYENIFAFSLSELTAGEKSLRHANLHEALYGTGLGKLANFQSVQAAIQRERENLFSPAAKKRTINRLIHEIRDKASEFRECLVKPRQYQELRTACDAQQKLVDGLRMRLEGLRRDDVRLERLAKALKPYAIRREARDKLARLTVPEGLPEDIVQTYQQTEKRRDDLAADVAASRNELESVLLNLDELKTKLSPSLLAANAQIRQLQHQVEKIRGIRQEIPVLKQQAETVKTLVLTGLRDINQSWELSDLDRIKIDLHQREQIDTLRADHDDLAQEEQQLKSRLLTVQKEIESANERRKSLAELEPATRLETLIEDAANYESNRHRLEALRGETEKLDRDIREVVTQLEQTLQQQIDLSNPLPVPGDEVVGQFRQRLSELETSRNQTAGQLEERRGQLTRLKGGLETIENQQPLFDRQQLLEARAERDLLWDLIRRKFVLGETLDAAPWEPFGGDHPDSASDQFQRLLAAADQIADDRQKHADLVAQRDQLLEDAARAERQIADTEQRLTANESQIQEAKDQWRETWASCNLQPRSPELMLQWLTYYRRWIDLDQRSKTVHRQLNELNNELTSYERELKEVFSDDQLPPSELLTMARQRHAESHAAAAERATLETQVTRRTEEFHSIQHQLNQLDDRRRKWHQRWKSLLDQCQLPENWTLHLTAKVLLTLSDARHQYAQALATEARCQSLRSQLSESELEIRQLCESLAPELLLSPAEDAVLELNQWLDEAQHAERDRQRLVNEQQKLQQRLKDKLAQLKNLEQSLDQIFRDAGTSGAEEFAKMIKSIEKQQALQSEVRTAEREITLLCGLDDSGQFPPELEETSADRLAVERERLVQHIQQVNDEYTEAVSVLTRQQDRLQQMDEASQAVDLSLDLQHRYSQLQAAVDRYAPLVIAQALLKDAVDSFQQQHQPRLLSDVSDLFQRMTNRRYTAIQQQLDEARTLLVVQSDGSRKHPGELSTGTREQLYLAIRLAYIQHYCREAEPLPIVMDDVLVNFDDERACATLDVLSQLGTEIQIVFLTCHEHIIELIRQRQLDAELIPLTVGLPAATTRRVTAK